MQHEPFQVLAAAISDVLLQDTLRASPDRSEVALHELHSFLAHPHERGLLHGPRALSKYPQSFFFNMLSLGILRHLPEGPTGGVVR